MARKYLSLDRLTEYDALIKGKINEGDEGVKSYVDTEIAKMATSSHTHDDRYYTETEIDDKLSTINTSISNIASGTTTVKNAEHATSADSATTATKATQDGDGKVIANTYETKDDANAKLQEAKEYADTKVSGLASTSSVESAISTHNTSSDAHSDIREILEAVKEDVDTFFKDATLSAEAKDTLKEIQDYITGDASAAAEMTASIANKADKVHTHAISDVSGLQDALDTNNEAIEGLTETIENVKEDAANQAVVVLAEAQKGIDANTDRIEVLETLVSNKVDTEHTHSWNDLEDRPFYEIISGDVLLEEQTATLLEDNGNGRYFINYTILSPLQLTAEEKYIVVWDGVSYETVYTNNKLGNLNAYHSQAPDSGEPFFIELNDLNLEICCPKEGEHTFAIYASNYSSEVKKLNSKFIPDISWNDLVDKPFYENISGDILLEERTVNLQNQSDNAYFIDISASLAVTQGNEYTVIWDGIPYKVTAGSNTLGNIYLVGGPDSGEPFFIGVSGSSLHIRGSQGEHTLEVYSNYNCEVKQLDEKFIPNISTDKLPDISWNNLKDKPFYEIISGDVFLEEQDINLSNKSGNGYNTSISIVLTVTKGNEYTVIWDGIPYKVIATTNTLGNMYWTGPSNNTGEPFFIGFDTSEIDIFAETQGKHTLAIYYNYNCEVKQLDEKYIPDTNWNNLLDRPFYENISGDILLEEQTVNCSESTGNGYSVYINASLAVTEGNEYTVIWDGIPYKVIAETNSLGNMYWSGSSTNTGEPFFIGVSGSSLYIATENQEEHTLEVYSNYSYELKQLEEKYIPNISWNNLKDRPFYEIFEGNVLLDEQTVDCSESYGNGYFTQISKVVTFTTGEEYTVIWDGIPYKITPTNNKWGNTYLEGSSDNTGEPFFINIDNSSIYIFAETQGEHTLEVYSDYNYELKQLDEKFIPDISIDKLPDISWNKISDKPFYENISGDILLEEQTVNCSDPYGNGYCTMISRVLSITEGTEYTIIWDGVPYKVIARTSGSSNSNDLGNKYIYNGVYGNTGEPFFIGVDGSSFHIYCAEQGEHTLEVYSNYNYEVKQLDEKFIPNVNWEKISNKPFYESISGDVLLEEQVINFTSDRIFKELSFIDNTIYTVIWDGVKYECLKEEGKNYIGNFSIVVPSSPDTGEPFFIDTPSIYCKTQGEHIVAIYSDYNCEVKKLDEKFIPDISWNNLKDKPFYENISGDVLLEKQIVNCSESTANGYSTNINASLTVIEGNEYTVLWDGVPYTLTAVGTTLGNIYWNGSSTNTGEPFFIGVSSSSLYIATENQEEHTLEVYSNYNYEVKQLDEKFIPDNIQRSTDNNLTTTDKTIVGAINELNNSGVGKSTTGTVYIIDDIEVTAFDGAEIFNNYSNNIATGMYSHAEGSSTTATGNYSHAEGALTKASSSYSHAEGHSTTASGAYSHAEGQYVKALSSYSHAEGRNTIASGENQHVQGKFNIEDTENKYAHIVGNGKTNKSRSNAHTLDWDGNAWYKGDLFVGGTSQDEGSKLVTESEVDVKLQDKANATHTHAISDITDLETTLANAASAISANTNSISANSNAISSLQTIVNDIQEISSEEIQALFNT